MQTRHGLINSGVIKSRGQQKHITLAETVREEHSKKPDEVRKRIVEFTGDVPRIELFARQAATGWDCWGNEVGKFEEVNE